MKGKILFCFFLLFSFGIFAQENKTYTSIEESLKNPSEVYKLDLKFANLNELPTEILNLPNLKELNLWGNNFTVFPSIITKLKQLKALNLCGNKINKIPSKIKKLKKLEHLNLSETNLNSLPKELGKLKKLKTLNLSFNQLDTLPLEFQKLKKLTKLNLSENIFSNLPTQLLALTNLKSLNLSANHLTTIPSQINNLFQLEYLNCQENELEALPEEIRELKNLKENPFEVYSVVQANEISRSNGAIKVKDFQKITKLEVVNLMINVAPIIPVEEECIVTSFVIYYTAKGKYPINLECSGATFSPEVTNIIQNIKPEDIIMFTEVRLSCNYNTNLLGHTSKPGNALTFLIK